MAPETNVWENYFHNMSHIVHRKIGSLLYQKHWMVLLLENINLDVESTSPQRLML